LEPLAIGARMALPVVDADFMGRAFPELQVKGFCIDSSFRTSSCWISALRDTTSAGIT
jgi:DUF917 family protein